MLSGVSLALMSGSKAFASEVRGLQVDEMPGCLDPHGELAEVITCLCSWF